MIERRLFGISAGLALAGSGAPVATASAQQTGASGRPDAQRAVAAFVAKYTDAYNCKDATGVASLYTEDGIVVQPGPMVTGRQNLERYWRAAFDAGRRDLRYETQQVRAEGNIVWSIGQFTVIGPSPQGGQIQQNHGVFVNIYQWEGDELRFRVHSFSLLPGAPSR